MQKELDLFKDTIWNTHRIRMQKDTYLPCGIPNHIYVFPEEYNLGECGKLFDTKLSLISLNNFSNTFECPSRFAQAGIIFPPIGLPVTDEQLREVAEQSGVLNVPDDFLEPDFRAKCQHLIPDVLDIEPKDIQDAYRFLKENFNSSN